MSTLLMTQSPCCEWKKREGKSVNTKAYVRQMFPMYIYLTTDKDTLLLLVGFCWILTESGMFESRHVTQYTD